MGISKERTRTAAVVVQRPVEGAKAFLDQVCSKRTLPNSCGRKLTPMETCVDPDTSPFANDQGHVRFFGHAAKVRAPYSRKVARKRRVVHVRLLAMPVDVRRKHKAIGQSKNDG